MMFNVRKKKVATYTLYASSDEEKQTEIFRLVDETGKNTLVTHNFTFIYNFILRLMDSGHKVVYDDSFCKDKKNDDGNCCGCVFDTGSGCMLTSSVKEESDVDDGI